MEELESTALVTMAMDAIMEFFTSRMASGDSGVAAGMATRIQYDLSCSGIPLVM